MVVSEKTSIGWATGEVNLRIANVEKVLVQMLEPEVGNSDWSDQMDTRSVQTVIFGKRRFLVFFRLSDLSKGSTFNELPKVGSGRFNLTRKSARHGPALSLV